MAYVAEGTQLGDGPKKTWKEVVDNDVKCCICVRLMHQTIEIEETDET